MAAALPCLVVSGQYSDGTKPVYVYSAAIRAWATECRVVRGYVRIDNPSSGFASHGNEADATGRADNSVVSLGDGGVAVVSFGEPFGNRPGPDFAVFENSFDGKYLELAFVEVSSDSTRWVRFPSESLTQTSVQTGTFGITDPGNITNLAGKFPALFGTPFFLEVIADSAGVDTDNIRYIRITDVTGSVDTQYASRDSYGNIVNDPWPTPFPQSGFDLDAVALIDMSLVGINDLIQSDIRIYPVPAGSSLMVETSSGESFRVRIIDSSGRICTSWHTVAGSAEIPVYRLFPGLYLAEIRRDNSSVSSFLKFIKSDNR